MKVNLRWLEEYVRVDVPLKRLTELLDNSGSKVEAVHTAGEGLGGVVVAEILDVKPHPNADNLTLVEVSTGNEQTERVVCGASNFTVGDRVPYATVGAHLGDMTISERKIRGEPSRGMLCSAAELDISKDHSGILVLPADTPLGEDVVATLDLDATVLELEITPNRGDCMGMIGIAREVAALLGNELRVPEVRLQEDPSIASPVKVEVDDARGCLRYLARYMEGITVGPSPLQISKRLMSVGIRPISNVVDITNYVMVETGQPLHAFDGARIPDRHIVVRRARSGEKLTTLDGVARDLHSDDLLICDREKPMAFAGLMGGEESEVSDETTTVILESASFDPATIAVMSQRHLLRTEASARFERGTDVNGVAYAAARAAEYMNRFAGAKVAAQVTDVYPNPVEPRSITLRPKRTSAVVGIKLPPDTQAKHLRSIQLESTEQDGLLNVTVPTFRRDLVREIDLIEEVARLAGFDRITGTIPPGRTGELTREQETDRRLKRILSGLGVMEAWTPAWTSTAVLDALGLPPDHAARDFVRIANPMTEDEAGMRTTLMPSLLNVVAHNTAHRSDSVAVFEMGRVYEPTDGEMPREASVLGAIFTGKREVKTWNSPERNWGFFAVKGVLESTMGALGVEIELAPVTGAPFHLTRAAQIHVGGKKVGAMGEIHPDVCENFDVPEGTVALEIALAPIYASLPERVTVEEIGRFPPTLIDLAVVVREEIPAGKVQEHIEELGKPEVMAVRLFDLYRGDQIEPGHKSLAYALELRAPDRTLTDEEALSVRDRIVQGLTERVGGRLRS
jgi:phenylalanyl-tRNA synthetase beta chain